MSGTTTNLERKVILRSVIYPLVLIAALFVSAGKLLYLQGIVYSVLTIAVLAATYAISRNNPELINERLHPKKGMKPWDKAYLSAAAVLYFSIIIIGPVDAVRCNNAQKLPGYVFILSIILYIAGYAIFLWARKTNNYFSSVVRIQNDRGHKVCNSGPYRIIRHPGYFGAIFYTMATPLLLGSTIALIPALLSVVLVIIRTILEDSTLKMELDGYKEYAEKVKYRLLPFIW